MAHAETGLITGARVAFASSEGPSDPPADPPAVSRPYSKTVLIVLEPSLRGKHEEEHLHFYDEVIAEVAAALGGSVLKQPGHDFVIRVSEHGDNPTVANELVLALQAALGARGVDLQHVIRETPAHLDPGLHPQIRHVLGFAQRGAIRQALAAKNHLQTVEACDILLRILRSPAEFPRPDAGHLKLIERVEAHSRSLLKRPNDIEARRAQFIQRVLALCEEYIQATFVEKRLNHPDPSGLIRKLTIETKRWVKEQTRSRVHLANDTWVLLTMILLATEEALEESHLKTRTIFAALTPEGSQALTDYDLVHMVVLQLTEESERERLQRWREAILGDQKGGDS
jgi:hypothetical protein